MKNISQIKEKLIKFRDNNGINQMLTTAPEGTALKIETIEMLNNVSNQFLNRLIKHLDSKRPGIASITNLMRRLFYKLQLMGVESDGLNCFLAIVVGILNNNFEGAFSNRLNVKSKEFCDLEDCEPF